MTELPAQFEEFHERISLGPKPRARIESAFKTLQGVLCNAYGVDASDVFMQGSCANNTAVEPADEDEGEYDLDIVVVIPEGDVAATQALEDLQAHLEADGRYRDKVTPKKPCVRLQYADDEIGGFHVDIVPVRRAPQDSDAPLEAPRRDDGWHGTAPAEYTDWCLNQGEGFSRTVKMLKRWRDEHQDVRSAVKSIVLQVLISKCMPPDESDARRLATALTQMEALLASQPGPPVVANPVLPSENLAASWSQESFNSFRQEVARARADAERAVNAPSDSLAAALWAKILGDDFPAAADEEGLVLADARHAVSVQAQGWYEQLDPNARVAVSATVFAEDRRRRIIRNLRNDGRVLPAGWNVKFFADATAPPGSTIWWQVVNTGGHARSVNGLRGDFFRAKTLTGAASPDERVNWEDTSYTGSHWIEAFVVRQGTVIARSGRFVVKVKHQGFRFVP